MLFWITVTVITSCSHTVFAGQPSISSMLDNFSMTIPELIRLAMAISYVTGMYFVVKGVANLRAIGKEKQGGGVILFSAQLVLILIGAALMYLPSAIQTGINTFFLSTDTVPYAYSDATTDEWSGSINICAMIMKLIGIISFIKGLITLKDNQPAQGDKSSSLSRGIAHLISGVFCINITTFVRTIWNTLGIN